MVDQNLEQCVSVSLQRVCGANAVRGVQCQVDGGVVTLRGTVSSREEMMMCVAVARTVPSVRMVDNQLSLGQVPETKDGPADRSDDSVAAE
ncbi:BON domain-containing protein [Roseimaritima sediminicola]|uniref:BON domain-containing protein n=1 Tax=Roseimaritima sediminicola TaxID=2662066 RepID=UPI0012982F4D|nr:BON domain-containing protein [Roseimaritima sediminicola]